MNTDLLLAVGLLTAPTALLSLFAVVEARRTRRAVDRSQPHRVAEEVRDEMRMLREHWEAFITALNPDHITEIVGRHNRRFGEVEGAIKVLRRDTDDLTVRVAKLEGVEG